LALNIPVCELNFHLNAGDGRFFRDFNAFEIHVRGSPSQTACLNAAHSNFLNKFLVEGVKCIKTMDFIVLRFVGGRVAEDHQRVEFL
jgi:hypothetical protein